MRWQELGRTPVRSGDGTELYFAGLATLGDRLVLMAVRYPIEGGRAVWTPWYSDDGVNWTESTLPGEPQEVTDLASTTDGVVAVGVSGRRNERRAMIWTTNDGAEWTVDSAPPIPMVSRIVRADQLTVLGSGVGLCAGAGSRGRRGCTGAASTGWTVWRQDPGVRLRWSRSTAPVDLGDGSAGPQA